MTYAILIVGFAGAAGLAAIVARRRMPRGAWTAMLVAFAALAVLTVVFDSAMIASGLFDYGDGTISGLRLWLAPIEDLAYPLVSVLVVATVWSLAGGNARRGDDGGTR